jgi:hypothetical protein
MAVSHRIEHQTGWTVKKFVWIAPLLPSRSKPDDKYLPLSLTPR